MEENRTTYRCPDCECTFSGEADLRGNIFCPDCGCIIRTESRRDI